MTDGKELIQDFIDLAGQHGQALLDGDSKRGNKIHSLATKRIKLIKNMGPQDRQLFYDLLDHDNDSVRMWVAVTLSGTFPERALAVLKDIKQKENIFGLTAGLTLDSISKGMIKEESWNKDE